MTHTIRKATMDDAGALAELAAVTFPLACPPSSSPEDIAAHLANTLSEGHFRSYLADPDITVLVIDAGGSLRGYSLLVNRPAADPDVAAALTLLPSVELSKCYVHPEHHGLGAAAELMLRASMKPQRQAPPVSGWASTARTPGPSASTKSPATARWARSPSGWGPPWNTTSSWNGPSLNHRPGPQAFVQRRTRLLQQLQPRRQALDVPFGAVGSDGNPGMAQPHVVSAEIALVLGQDGGQMDHTASKVRIKTQQDAGKLDGSGSGPGLRGTRRRGMAPARGIRCGQTRRTVPAIVRRSAAAASKIPVPPAWPRPRSRSASGRWPLSAESCGQTDPLW